MPGIPHVNFEHDLPILIAEEQALLFEKMKSVISDDFKISDEFHNKTASLIQYFDKNNSEGRGYLIPLIKRYPYKYGISLNIWSLQILPFECIKRCTHMNKCPTYMICDIKDDIFL